MAGDEMLAALRELGGLYGRILTGLRFGQKYFEFPHEDRAEYDRAKQKILDGQQRMRGLLEQARRNLLETGHNAPDSWLVTQTAFLSCGGEWRPDGSLVWSIDTRGADVDAIQAIYDEIVAAAMRLEASPTATDDDDRWTIGRTRTDWARKIFGISPTTFDRLRKRGEIKWRPFGKLIQVAVSCLPKAEAQ